VPRYRFSEFLLSPRRRVLLRNGREQPLIPRYFDLLVFLVEHRHEAVHRREIFDKVWSDVVVSDSALSQAIRTIRRVLGDDPREPMFIRTVSRHGYQFIYAGLHEEPDDDPLPEGAFVPDPAGTADDPFEPLFAQITRPAADDADEEVQREAAEILHGLGTEEALRRLGTRPGHAYARALLRDTRWQVAQAGPVPLLGHPGAASAAWALVRLRAHRAARLAARRWAAAAVGGGVAGAIAGSVGGLLLVALPGGAASLSVVPVLAAIGAAAGATGAAGVGGGLSAAETIARSRRSVMLMAGGALGGGVVGVGAEWLSRWTLGALVGLDVQVGGGLEGVVIGGAAGLAYGLATARARDGLAAPRGRSRFRVVLATALACAVASLTLALSGRPLVGGTIHAIAAASQRSEARLTPLAHLIGEPDFGRVTGTIIGAGEGLVFGFGLAIGLTRRPPTRPSRGSH
jgi:DNA-binding winged helix-turn-helix (wHTH) protein